MIGRPPRSKLCPYTTRFRSLVVHTPRGSRTWPLPWTFSTFDYRTLCALLFAQSDADFETVKDDGVTTGAVHTVHTDRRSEEHTSELQSRQYLVFRLLLQKKN